MKWILNGLDVNEISEVNSRECSIESMRLENIHDLCFHLNVAGQEHNVSGTGPRKVKIFYLILNTSIHILNLDWIANEINS